MQVFRADVQRLQRQLPSIYSDPTITPRNLTPLGRPALSSRVTIEPLSPYMAEVRRTRAFSNSRRQSSGRTFRIHEYFGKSPSTPTQQQDLKPLATIYLTKKGKQQDFSSTTPLVPTSVTGHETKNQKSFRRTKYYNGTGEQVVTPVLNHDNLRKIAYNQRKDQSIENTASSSKAEPKKKFRQNKYVCSDEVKHKEVKVDESHDNLLDYVEQDSQILSPTANKYNQLRINQDWPEKLRSVSQIQMQMYRMGPASKYLNNFVEDGSLDRDDYISEIAVAQHRKEKLPVYSPDFTFELSKPVREKKLSWSELS